MESQALATCLKLRPIQTEDRGFLAQVYASTRTEELALVAWSDTQKKEFLQITNSNLKKVM